MNCEQSSWYLLECPKTLTEEVIVKKKSDYLMSFHDFSLLYLEFFLDLFSSESILAKLSSAIFNNVSVGLIPLSSNKFYFLWRGGFGIVW